jgi:GNAT superfamily N-acetyltransferase
LPPGFLPVEPLDGTHDASRFNSGKPSLGEWLRKYALRNQSLDSSRTFVSCPDFNPKKVAGYYSLSVGSVQHDDSPAAVSKRMPHHYPIPVMLLARLAVDSAFHGMRLGSALLKDALLRTAKVATDAGIRALIVDAIDDEARAFYEHFGFEQSPTNELQLFLRMSQIRASVIASELKTQH